MAIRCSGHKALQLRSSFGHPAAPCPTQCSRSQRLRTRLQQRAARIPGSRPAHLDEQAAVHGDAGAAVVVQPPAVAAALVGVQVHAARLGSGAADQLQPLVQLPASRMLQLILRRCSGATAKPADGGAAQSPMHTLRPGRRWTRARTRRRFPRFHSWLPELRSAARHTIPAACGGALLCAVCRRRRSVWRA